MSVMSPLHEDYDGGMTGERTVAATFSSAPESIRDARRFVAALVEPASDVEIAELLVSELATNAVRHGSGPFTVIIVLGGARLRIEVFDHDPVPLPEGDATSSAVGFGLDDPAEGLSFRLLEKLSAGWGVEAVAGGKAVYFEL